MAESVAKLTTAPADKADDLKEVDPGTVGADILYRTNRRSRDMLKRVAIDEQSSVQAIIHEALNDWLIKRGRPPMS
ncbi:ribbon-helix-helix domain-containing protein [Paradevosia shaoguanensis]|uniref:Antitoxin-like ribbon-helix-helix domain-containing protein n=1 Tax=Paradevosia shaoguanensis TaxID=1335043 RepID=A0AA41QN29_9HYPH|nr:ribbon-helix-helix domain-containing protein [Paradevosia shaoguanensis]MCF1742048.1 hypothetical protein [Paradevosia shaoguanensis]MCI0126531.1 hypothetical protein [Paradevosia shaoguanensis]